MKDWLMTGRSAAAAILAVALIIAIAPSGTARSICRDGTYTESEGSGTCSYHGGVAQSGVPNKTPSTAPTTPGSTVSSQKVTTVRHLLASLAVAPEQDAGYDRDLFRLWLSVGGCDTRQRGAAEVRLRIWTGRGRLHLKTAFDQRKRLTH